MQKKYFVFVILVFLPIRFFALHCFDQNKWVKTKEVEDIELYQAENDNDKLKSYKAVTKVKISGSKLFGSLIDFDDYPRIFPRTIFFKRIQNLGENKFIIHSLIDFSPLKNREYYIELEYSVNDFLGQKRYTIEWKPLESVENYPSDKKAKLVKTIYGRWDIIEIDQRNAVVSVEYYNDFEINAPSLLIQNIEKQSTITALKNLVNFTLTRL